MVCQKIFDSTIPGFKISGPADCKMQTSSSIKRSANKKAIENTKLRTRQKGGNGKTRTACPATSKVNPQKTTIIRPSNPASGSVMNSLQQAKKAKQMASAATAGSRPCSQKGGRRKTRKRHYKTRKNNNKNKRRKSKSRKTRK